MFVRGIPSNAAFNGIYPAAAFNTTDAQWPNAADVVGGGTYVLSGADFVVSSSARAIVFDSDTLCEIAGRVAIASADPLSQFSGPIQWVPDSVCFWNTGSSGSWGSGSLLSVASGVTVSIASTINCARIVSSVNNSLFPGAEIDQLTIGAGGQVIIGGTVALTSAASATWGGTYTMTGIVAPSGTGHVRKRVIKAIADADGQSFGINDGDVLRLAVLTTNRVLTINDTGAGDGDTLEVTSAGSTGTGSTLSLVRSDTSAILGLQNLTGHVNYTKLMRIAGRWEVIAAPLI